MILQVILIALIAVFFITVYILYRKVFYRREDRPENTIPSGLNGSSFMQEMLDNIEKIVEEPYEEVRTLSADGLWLNGFYYENVPGAPVMISFHGYHSPPRRDSSGVFRICRETGINLLVVEERAHGRSEGNVITFGIRERFDVLCWVRYVNETFGEETPIVLAGLSMGAATVLMASELPMPDNVKGIEADCAYTSPREVIGVSIRKMKLPVGLTYGLVRLGARMFGRFDPDQCTVEGALKNAKLPVLLIHGTGDEVCPYDMCRRNYDACKSEKKMLSVAGAPHGVSYYYDQAGYHRVVKDFMKACGILS